MEEAKFIKTFNAPAGDFLLYEMMEAANTSLIKDFQEDGSNVYEYALPFIQDETENIIYDFYMKDNKLIKLKISFRDQTPRIFEISEFIQETPDEKVFEYPSGYTEESYNFV